MYVAVWNFSTIKAALSVERLQMNPRYLGCPLEDRLAEKIANFAG